MLVPIGNFELETTDLKNSNFIYETQFQFELCPLK